MTDFVRAQQLITSLVNLQASQQKFAEPGANPPTININFTIDHPATQSTVASSETVSISLSLPVDVAASAATAVAQAILTAMQAMGLPTS